MAEWRAGRSVGRTLYLDDKLVGLVDTPELAAEIVETMNRVGRLLDEVRGELPPGAAWVEPGRSFAMNASSEPTRLLPESGRERSLPPVRCSAVTADDGHVQPVQLARQRPRARSSLRVRHRLGRAVHPRLEPGRCVSVAHAIPPLVVSYGSTREAPRGHLPPAQLRPRPWRGREQLAPVRLAGPGGGAHRDAQAAGPRARRRAPLALALRPLPAEDLAPLTRGVHPYENGDPNP